MLRLAFDFIITWRETRTRPNAYADIILKIGQGLFIFLCLPFRLHLLSKDLHLL